MLCTTLIDNSAFTGVCQYFGIIASERSVFHPTRLWRTDWFGCINGSLEWGLTAELLSSMNDWTREVGIAPWKIFGKSPSCLSYSPLQKFTTQGVGRWSGKGISNLRLQHHILRKKPNKSCQAAIASY